MFKRQSTVKTKQHGHGVSYVIFLIFRFFPFLTFCITTRDVNYEATKVDGFESEMNKWMVPMDTVREEE